MGRTRIISSGGANGYSSGGLVPGLVLADSQAPLIALNRSIRPALYFEQPVGDDGDLPTQSAQSFNYYISPTGSDTNPGTLAAPWAITSLQANNANNPKMAGMRIGLLPGTYPISSLMGTNEAVAALTIPGGSSSSPTYIGSSNSSGNYSRGTATLQANDNGLYGGGNSNASPMMAGRAGANYWIVDGLVFTGFSLWAFHVGNSPSGGANPIGWTIQNCTFTGGSAQNSSSSIANGTNLAPLIIYASVSGTVTNNYIYDNTGWTDTTHFSAVYQWGLGATNTTGTIFTYNTIIDSGGLHGKEHNQEGTTIAFNYIDWTAGPNGQNGSCVQGFDGAPTSGYTETTSIHHNVFLCNYIPLDLQPELGSGGWSTSCEIYNNTIITTTGIVGVVFDWYEAAAGSDLLFWYNNLVYDNGHAPGGYGYALVNIDAFGLCDYNIWGGHSPWSTVPAGQTGSTGSTSYSTFSAWKTAIGNLDAHSQNGVATFTNSGALALQYTITSGIAYQTGRVGGISTGAICNVGAWDGVVTQIGCNFAS